MGENVALVLTGDVVLLLTAEAKLIAIKVKADKYEALAEYRLSQSQTWAYPVLLKDRVLIKDVDTLTCWSFAEGE
jgi:hypothetical protein